MAKADYNVADRDDTPKTALDRVNETVYESPDAENKTEAYAAGFQDASFIGYEAALTTLEGREDMEPFAAYTARTYGVTGATFDAGRHMRELPNRSGGNGFANDPANEIVVGPDTDNDGTANASDAAPADPAVH
jgi:hypothetical protein